MREKKEQDFLKPNMFFSNLILNTKIVLNPGSESTGIIDNRKWDHSPPPIVLHLPSFSPRVSLTMTRKISLEGFVPDNFN